MAEEEKKKISNRRVYTYIAIIFLVIFIIGVIALGVIRIGKGGGSTPSKTYYSYVVNNSYLTPDSSLEDDGKTFIVSTQVKYKETMVLEASTDASIGVYDVSESYLFGGKDISFTFSIDDEKYCLDEVVMEKIMVLDTDYDEFIDRGKYELPKEQYQGEYNSESKTYKLTINHINQGQVKTYPYEIHSIALKYAVKNK